MTTHRIVRVACASAFLALLMSAGGPHAWSAPAPVHNPLLGLRPLTIQTVPAIVGARFVLDGKVLVTGSDGAVRTTTTTAQRDAIASDRNAHLSVQSTVLTVHNGVRGVFAGWFDGGYHFGGKNNSGQLLLAAFNLDYLTTFSFARPDGHPISANRITDMQLTLVGGSTVALHGTEPVWLRGLQIDPASGQLAVRDISYRISSVMSGGNDVVRRDEQVFTPSHHAQVNVRVLFFSLKLTLHDALFGFDTGTYVNLRFADGSVLRVPLDHGAASVVDLPRGNYSIKTNARGILSDDSFTLSRSQTVRLRVFSVLDIATFMLAIVIAAATLLLAGRTLRRRARRAEHRSAERRVIDLGRPVVSPARGTTGSRIS